MGHHGNKSGNKYKNRSAELFKDPPSLFLNLLGRVWCHSGGIFGTVVILYMNKDNANIINGNLVEKE